VDTAIAIWIDGKKRGTMLISKGSLDWYPKRAQKARPITWSNLANLLDNHREAMRFLRQEGLV
jgi:hypothetical protein